MAPPKPWPDAPSVALQDYLPAFERADDEFLRFWSINKDKSVSLSVYTRCEFWALAAAAGQAGDRSHRSAAGWRTVGLGSAR